MSGTDPDYIRVCHIRDASNEIEEYLKQYPVDDLRSNSMFRNAVIRQLEIVGEASSSVSSECKDKYPEIQWASMSGLRNILIHKYFGVDVEIIKQVVIRDLPELKMRIIKIIESFDPCP